MSADPAIATTIQLKESAGEICAELTRGGATHCQRITVATIAGEAVEVYRFDPDGGPGIGAVLAIRDHDKTWVSPPIIEMAMAGAGHSDVPTGVTAKVRKLAVRDGGGSHVEVGARITFAMFHSTSVGARPSRTAFTADNFVSCGKTPTGWTCKALVFDDIASRCKAKGWGDDATVDYQCTIQAELRAGAK